MSLNKIRWSWFFLFLGILFILPWFGGESISFAALWKSDSPFAIDHTILWELRIPRLLLVISIGGSLALVGATYQILFNNALAEPYIFGVSSAVTLGIVIGEVWLHLPYDSLFNLTFGFLFSFIMTLLLVLSYYWKTGREMERIVLFGMGLNFILSSAIFLILSQHSQSVGSGSLRWLFGNIPWVSLRDSLLFLILTLPFCAILWFLGRSLDALSLGDSVALTMGVSPNKLRTLILLITSFHLTLITAKTGSIGFLGLVVPHCARLIFRPGSTRSLFLISFFVGALFLGISDSLSRALLPPLEFPIGIFTTLIGGPLFLYILWKR